MNASFNHIMKNQIYFSHPQRKQAKKTKKATILVPIPIEWN